MVELKDVLQELVDSPLITVTSVGPFVQDVCSLCRQVAVPVAYKDDGDIVVGTSGMETGTRTFPL